MVRSMVRTGPPKLARDNGQGQGGHAGYVLAPPGRERGLSPIHHTSIQPHNTYLAFSFKLRQELFTLWYTIIGRHPKSQNSIIISVATLISKGGSQPQPQPGWEEPCIRLFNHCLQAAHCNTQQIYAMIDFWKWHTPNTYFCSQHFQIETLRSWKD